MLKIIFIIVALCIGTSSYALDTYKTQDVLLLYKSCYETIFFLGNTKYRGKRIPLKPEKVSAHCFCVCDKIRLNFKSKEFMNMEPGTINRTISPYSNECIKQLGPFWEEVSTLRDYVQPDEYRKRGLWQKSILV